MQKKSASPVEQDYRLFFVFMTIIMALMFYVSLIENPDLRTSWLVIPFTGLLTIHIILHWNVNRILKYPNQIRWYLIGQGLLAFVIVNLSRNIGMVFALYMALIGETIGILRANRWSLLAIIYYLVLSIFNIFLFTNLNNAITWLSTSIPIAIFVSLFVALYNRQNEAREQAQALAADLEAANRQLSEYAAQVEDLSIANERQRMARELHDTLSQGLAGLILQLEAADAHLTNNHSNKARAIVTDAMEQARVTLADARNAIDDLRQSPVDDLDSALRLEISRFSNATGIPIIFHADQVPPLPDPVTETVIRSVTEALTNVANHAKAQNVEVNARMKDKSLLVTIQDDGQGFDASAIPSGHYGILGIKERVRLVNGSFEIQSENGKGTTLKIEVPTSPLALSGTSRQASEDEAEALT
jgi:two-component system, NarL family, sensor histidine kinase YdfH